MKSTHFNINIISISICCLCIFSSCLDDPGIALPEQTFGLAPKYISAAAEIIAESLEPREFVNLGKIVTVGNSIFILEIFEGIHVIDNTNPNSPTGIAFWSIPGAIDFTISDDILFVGNSRDLIVIEIIDVNNLSIVSIEENKLSSFEASQFAPPDYFGFFECVDSSKGIVVGWKEAELNSPQCWR